MQAILLVFSEKMVIQRVDISLFSSVTVGSSAEEIVSVLLVNNALAIDVARKCLTLSVALQMTTV